MPGERFMRFVADYRQHLPCVIAAAEGPGDLISHDYRRFAVARSLLARHQHDVPHSSGMCQPDSRMHDFVSYSPRAYILSQGQLLFTSAGLPEDVDGFDDLHGRTAL